MHEWENEPNRKHFVDEATGLDCLIVRSPTNALCGYDMSAFRRPIRGTARDATTSM